MHDLDRVLFEQASGDVAGEGPHGEFLEVLAEMTDESSHETYESEVTSGAFEMPGELDPETAQSLEAYETELATELLAVSGEAELDRFLGKLVSSAAGAARGFVASPAGRQLKGILRKTVKQALPVVAGAVGDQLSPGGGGQKWGRRIGKAAGDLFGLELEGLSGEDRELEVARSFVRFADAASRAAARQRQVDPGAAVRRAIAVAARQHAPGLFARLPELQPADASGPRAASGRWVRRGGVIVLYGA